MRIMKCSNCGANLELEKNMKIAYCMYCGSKMVIYNSEENIKVMEMVNKIDLLLQSRENDNPIPKKDINMAYDIAKTLIKLYPSNYLGFLKMAQICLINTEPLIIDDGSEKYYRYKPNYFHIIDSLKQARILASESLIPEVNDIDMEFKRRIAYEKKKYIEKHAFIKDKMKLLLNSYPQVLNYVRISSKKNVPSIIPGGSHLSYIDNRKNVIFEGDYTTYERFLGHLIFCKEKLYYCSNSIKAKGFLESLSTGKGYVCKIDEVHINKNVHIVDNNNNNLLIEGKPFRIEFTEYSYQFQDTETISCVNLVWQCFWGTEVKTEVNSISYSLFKEMFENSSYSVS